MGAFILPHALVYLEIFCSWATSFMLVQCWQAVEHGKQGLQEVAGALGVLGSLSWKKFLLVALKMLPYTAQDHRIA
jgi:hypothetical protein